MALEAEVVSSVLRAVSHNYPGTTSACWEQVSTTVYGLLQAGSSTFPGHEVHSLPWKDDTGNTVSSPVDKCLTAAIKIEFKSKEQLYLTKDSEKWKLELKMYELELKLKVEKLGRTHLQYIVDAAIDLQIADDQDVDAAADHHGVVLAAVDLFQFHEAAANEQLQVEVQGTDPVSLG
ncbi:hypothetical protein ACLOJK_027151 [Asimina triloba]